MEVSRGDSTAHGHSVAVSATVESPTMTRRSFPVLALVGALTVAGCGRHADERPDVVLIVVDTLRPDRLPMHGGPAGLTPFLDGLAERSLVFENAWSPSPWTLPAMVSILTSVHPQQHGVSSLKGLELGPDDEPIPVNCIPAQVETLAEVMRRQGYRTFGVASNVLVGQEVGFDRGFDRFVKLDDEPAEAVNAVVEGWSDELRASRPSFLYVHYFDPHDVYHTREPWFDLALGSRAADWTAQVPLELENPYADLDWLATRVEPRPDWLGERKASDLSPQEIEDLLTWIRAAYVSEIGYLDASLGRLAQCVDLERSLVVFLADHGEEFYEHGALTHGQNLYAESLRVPLLLSIPGNDAPRGRVSANVSTLDVVPTLRGLLGLPPAPQDRGHDLLAPSPERDVYGVLQGKSGQHGLEGDLRSIVAGSHRLILGGPQGVELYDLAQDPRERVNLAGERPALVDELRARLERLERDAAAYPRTTRVPDAPPSRVLLEHLQGLGYAGD